MSHSSLILLFLILVLFSCRPENTTNPEFSAQGIFEFPSEFFGEEDEEIPDYLDPETILCNGKGIRVANCISKQLKKGICLGIIKHGKRVYAVEIPCNDIKKTEFDSLATRAPSQLH